MRFFVVFLLFLLAVQANAEPACADDFGSVGTELSDDQATQIWLHRKPTATENDLAAQLKTLPDAEFDAIFGYQSHTDRASALDEFKFQPGVTTQLSFRSPDAILEYARALQPAK